MAHLHVPAGDMLVVAQIAGNEELSSDPRCVVTWSGYRPRVLAEVQ